MHLSEKGHTYALFAMTRAQVDGNSELVMHYMMEFYFESAAMILTLITVGKMLEARSKGKTTDALKSLMKLAPKTATLLRDGAEVTVPIEQVQKGDIFVVRPGENIPVDGIVVVTSPQDLVSLIVTKAVRMAEMMHKPILGVVENYSYFQCPDCGKRVEIFGKSKLDELALQFSLPVLARLPIDPAVAASFDAGRMAQVNTDPVMPAAELMAKA